MCYQCLFNSNNFPISAVLMEVCAVWSANLVQNLTALMRVHVLLLTSVFGLLVNDRRLTAVL